MLSNKEHSTPNYILCIVFSSYISSFFTLKIRLLGAKQVWLAFYTHCSGDQHPLDGYRRQMS